MSITVVPHCCCAVSLCSDDPWSVPSTNILEASCGSKVKAADCQETSEL